MSELPVIDFSIGIGLLILAFLVKRYPILIAGYNTLPREKKEKVNIKGLSTLIAVFLLFLSVSLSGLLNPILVKLGVNFQPGPLFFLVLLGFLIINAQFFDHNWEWTYKRHLLIFLNGLLLFIVIISVMN